MKPVRILVADDHALVRRGIRTLLENQPGWKVCAEASDGRDAVEKAKQLRPDIVILDIGMPSLNGLAAARQILQNDARQRILILTITESEQVVREVLEVGARGFVLKSDAARDLVAAVEALQQAQAELTAFDPARPTLLPFFRTQPAHAQSIVADSKQVSCRPALPPAPAIRTSRSV